MKPARVFILTSAAMIAFAANSLLCRVALRTGTIDAASFSSIRIASGAACLWLILKMGGTSGRGAGSWISAIALFAYVAAFSFAYNSLTAGTGALLLFAAVQTTMIMWGLRNGEHLRPEQWIGVALAFAGLILLLLPGLSTPSPSGSALMLSAGVAWGIYSLRGKNEREPVKATAGNFVRAVPITVLLTLGFLPWLRLDASGIVCAIASGAITSGLGYVVWYSALPGLTATGAATVQLSAPVLAAIGGVILLNESLTVRAVVASVAVLAGIALVVARKKAGAR
jgi:drug/metabolite transporter (DMT)-like permease